MNQEKIFEELTALPVGMQQEVMDFIAYLRQKYAFSKPGNGDRVADVTEDPFFGMWQDRLDMTDSSRWVRTVRNQEWG